MVDGTKKLSVAIGFGIVTLLILACVASMLIALLLKFTNINEGTLNITLLYLRFFRLSLPGLLLE